MLITIRVTNLSNGGGENGKLLRSVKKHETADEKHEFSARESQFSRTFYDPKFPDRGRSLSFLLMQNLFSFSADFDRDEAKNQSKHHAVGKKEEKSKIRSRRNFSLKIFHRREIINGDKLPKIGETIQVETKFMIQ